MAFAAHTQDPVILSGTAFVAYLTRATGIGRPHAWLVAHFVAANIASAVLVSSNPTNVLIASVRLILSLPRNQAVVD